jgi:hypothetical protein
MTDEVVRAAGKGLSGCKSSFSFLGLPLIPQVSDRVLSCPPKTLRLEVELFLRLESKYVVDLIDGLGLGTV